MATILVQEAASYRLDEIYRYTRDRWGVRQADGYINGMFAALPHRVRRRRIKADPGRVRRRGLLLPLRTPLCLLRRLSKGEIGIVTILHERMHQIDRFHEDFGL